MCSTRLSQNCHKTPQKLDSTKAHIYTYATQVIAKCCVTKAHKYAPQKFTDSHVFNVCLENFVFANEGVNSPLLLIDFGIALKINDKRRYDDLLGTPFYMAPECVTKAMRRGEDLKKGDIWAIGVVAYILCTGKPPFVGNTTKEIFYQLATQEVTFSKQTKLSSEGRTFLLRLLDRDYFARPTGEVCMADPWMQCNQDNDLGADVVGKLVNFKLARKLKRIVSKIVKKQQGEQGETDLKNFFVNLDHNKDGKIDIEEVSNFLRAHDFPEFKVNEKATEIMKAIDNDKDGKVTIKEFEEGWSKYKISKDKKLCYAIYKVFDRNGDGSIDMSELKKVIMGPNKKESAELRNLFKFFDTNNDGEISFQEFENALKNLQIMDDDSLATANRVSCLFSLGLKPDHDEKHISLAHDAEYVRKSIQNGEPLNLDIKG